MLDSGGHGLHPLPGPPGSGLSSVGWAPQGPGGAPCKTQGGGSPTQGWLHLWGVVTWQHMVIWDLGGPPPSSHQSLPLMCPTDPRDSEAANEGSLRADPGQQEPEGDFPARGQREATGERAGVVGGRVAGLVLPAGHAGVLAGNCEWVGHPSEKFMPGSGGEWTAGRVGMCLKYCKGAKFPAGMMPSGLWCQQRG